MARLTLEELAERVEALEHLLQHQIQVSRHTTHHVQTTGPRCKNCGSFTTYTRVRRLGLCMKCEREAVEC